MSALLEVEGLSVGFRQRGRRVLRAVDGVDLAVDEGDSLGIVGESGCGKSTLVRAILGLQTPTSGRIRFEGRDITRLRGRDRRRGGIQVVFQDPATALDPRFTVHDCVAEPLRISGEYRPARVDELLDQVGLSPEQGAKHPGALSGGQRQRVGIARALARDPRLLVLDEPVSALDLSIQAQVMNLLQRLQRERGLSILFIAHDLGVVRHMSSRIGVMYLGRFVETADRDALFAAPQHPYTRALIDAIPIDDPRDRARARERVILSGELPDPADPPSGCRFRTRCPIAVDECAAIDPGATPLIVGSREVACLYPLAPSTPVMASS